MQGRGRLKETNSSKDSVGNINKSSRFRDSLNKPSLSAIKNLAGIDLPRTSKLSPSSSRYSPQNLQSLGNMKVLILSNVKIELYKGNTQVETIASNTLNDGEYKWPVPTTFVDSSNYKIRISCVGESNVYGESNKFEIWGFVEKLDNEENVKKCFKRSHKKRWKVEDGLYKCISIPPTNDRSTSHYKLGEFLNFSLEARCSNEDGHVWYGLGFRGNEKFSKFYFFYVNSEGNYWVLKHDNGKEDTLIDQTPHSAIITGYYKWNKLKVAANGKSFIFYVNDTEVDRITINEAPDKGIIGLVAKTCYTRINFDDVSVSVIE